MSNSAVNTQNGTPWILLAGVLLISFSVLALEITLTRILSVMLSHHYVFVAISMAVLGLGWGGIFVYLFRRASVEQGKFGHMALFAGLFSLSIPLAVIAMVKSPYVDNVLFYCFVILIPFFLAGVVLAQAFQLFAHQSGKVYGADMMGAAVGALLVIPLLNRLGGVNGAILVSLPAAVACLLFATQAAKRRIWVSAANIFIVGAILVASVAIPGMANVVIGENPKKSIHDAFYSESSPGGRIVETRWTSFGRTDLVQFDSEPDKMGLYLDATAGTPMFRFSGDPDDPGLKAEVLKFTFPGYFPFLFLEEAERDNALIIGPGGGRDVLLALMGEVKQITAVEVNGDLVDMVKEYSWYNGGIYTDFANVNIVVDEGRNFLRRQKEKFDIIMLSMPVTYTSRSPEGFALTEDFLFTKESIRDYLDHLTEEGRLLVVGHHQLEIMRLISISLAALEEMGIGSRTAVKHIYTVGSNMYPLFVLKKTKFEPEEIFVRHRVLHFSPFDPSGSNLPYVTRGSGQVHIDENRFDQCGVLGPVLTTLGDGDTTLEDWTEAISEQGYDISLVTDNTPFFYNFKEGVPRPLSLALWVSAGFLLLSILAPPVYWKKRNPFALDGKGNPTDSLWNQFSFVLLFSMLGVGFMLAEISLIQRFILFLGAPILSFTVVLFSVLFGAGIGSISSGRISSQGLVKGITIVSLCVSLVLLAYAFLVLPLLGQLLGLSLPVRSLISAGMLIPLGFLLGFPVPLGIRLLKERGLERHIAWMWGINGTASVVGSVAAIVVAMKLGLVQVLLISAACYFLASLPVLRRVGRRDALQLSSLDDQ